MLSCTCLFIDSICGIRDLEIHVHVWRSSAKAWVHPQRGFSCTGGVWHTGELDWTRDQSSSMKILARKFLLQQDFYPEAQALTSHVCKLQSLSMKRCMCARTVLRESSGFIIDTSLWKSLWPCLPSTLHPKCKKPEEDLVSKTHENSLNSQRHSSSKDTASTRQGSWRQGWVQSDGRRLQAVTGRLACGGPSGLASGPRQGLMQQGRLLSILPWQASYKGLAHWAFGNHHRDWLHLQSRSHRRWPWRPQRWWESFRGAEYPATAKGTMEAAAFRWPHSGGCVLQTHGPLQIWLCSGDILLWHGICTPQNYINIFRLISAHYTGDKF